MGLQRIATLYSKELRKNMTLAEKLFWQEVRKKKIKGYRFLRQHPLFYDYWGKRKFFIADFYCRALKLVVEIDGGIHESQKDYDLVRTQILKTYKNLRIIRFKNKEVIENIDDVIKRLRKFIG